MDNVCFHIGLYAFHSCSILSTILYDDSRRIIGRIRRRTALVRKMYLFNCSSRSLLNCLRYRRKCSCHTILRPLLHVLSNGASVGKSYIFSRWVVLLRIYMRIYAAYAMINFIPQGLNVPRKIFAYKLSLSSTQTIFCLQMSILMTWRGVVRVN